CPLADAKAACFVKRPHGDQAAFGHACKPQAGPEPSGSGPARRKRDFGSRAATGEEELRLRIAGQDRASARELRNPAGPRASAHGPSGGTEASAEDPVFSGILASARMPKRWERGASSGLPSGEPPGLRPCRGAGGETGKRLRPKEGLRRKRRGNPRFRRRGPEVIISGDLATDAQIHVDGRIDGNVHCATLCQGPAGIIAGNIIADEARLCGTVEGTVSARNIVVEATARIMGDIAYETISIE